MKFNWIYGKKLDKKLLKRSVDLEYELRPKITRFLMQHLEKECDGDFSSFHFDVNMTTQKISISSKTPTTFTQKIEEDFEREINTLQKILASSKRP